MNHRTTRRSFLQAIGLGTAALGVTSVGQSAEQPIKAFEESPADADTSKGWKPISDRTLRVGIAGYGQCKFGAQFGFQDHPNVEVVAVTDLFPDRCAALAKECRCERTYPSLEEMVKDDRIEAVFAATDAPSHARHCIEVLKHGKHVATAVPAAFGSIEKNLPDLKRPPLPPGVKPGGHGGSHGHLMNEFVIPPARSPMRPSTGGGAWSRRIKTRSSFPLTITC